jgi:transcription elongation factor GreB
MRAPEDDDEAALEEAEEARQKLAKGPLYMTPRGHQILVDELAALGAERAKVVQTVSDAAAEGDRSENAEYIYGKRRLRQIDGRMRRVRKIVEAAVLIDPALDRGDRIFFGATVVLSGTGLSGTEDDGEQVTYQLVGEHETDAALRRISFQSPLGIALLKKEADDVVHVETPSGRRTYTVISVRYE